MTKILIIEDEPELVKILRSYLEKENYEVIHAYRGDTGLKRWEQEKPDLILLDLNLPGMNGLDVAREIRKKDPIPIIIITARVEETDQIIGLELGADNYITKPFSPRVVVAKTRALLRRSTPPRKDNQILRFGDLLVDPEAHIVTLGGKTLDLTPTEFDLLSALVSHPGKAYSRTELLEATQGTAYEGYERTIDAHIKNLRGKIESDPKNPYYIETVFGIGYRFNRSAGD